MLTLCCRYNVDRFSFVAIAILLPKSEINFFACGPHGPNVSNPSGTKWYCPSSELYSEILLSSAVDATQPAFRDVCFMYDFATVSPQVASHSKHFPTDQGIKVRPSGRLPSSLTVPGGSLIAGTPADTQPLRTVSFNK